MGSGLGCLGQAIQCLVIPVGVMMEKGQLLGLGQYGIVDDALYGRVTPAGLGGKFIQYVLRIVDDQIGTFEKLNVTSVFVMNRHFTW